LDLGSVGSAAEVASYPSNGSCELSSVPSERGAGDAELTEAGDVAVLDAAENPPLPRKADNDETGRLAVRRARTAAHDV
jgi:hypothetical protein